MKYRYFFAIAFTTRNGNVIGTNAQLELDRPIEDLNDIHDAQDKLAALFANLECRTAVINNYILMKVLP